MTTLIGLAERAAAWLRARPSVIHWGGTALFAVACIVLVAAGNVGIVADRELGRWVFAAPIAIAAAGSALRRRQPGASLALSLVAVGIDVALGGSNAVILYVVDGLYSSSCYGRRAVRHASNGVAVAGAVLVISGVLSAGANTVVLAALQSIAIFGTPVWWGTNVRQRNEIAELGEERLALERERTRSAQRIAELQRDDAVRSERARMASELHDVVASRLSAVAIGSAAALGIPESNGDPERERERAERRRAVLETVRESSIAALDDMRSLITVLRAGDAELGEPSSVDVSLNALRELRRAASGIDLVLTLPHDAAYTGLGEPLRQAIVRVAGEIVANAVKHAPGCRLALTVEIDSDVRLTGRSSRPARVAGDQPVPSAGIGLSVIGERASAFGGSLEAGPVGDEWIVDVRIPRHAGADAA